MMSAVAPGASGTIMRIGLVGQDCATALFETSARKTASMERRSMYGPLHFACRNAFNHVLLCEDNA
jgi:hypothetical protein